MASASRPARAADVERELGGQVLRGGQLGEERGIDLVPRQGVDARGKHTAGALKQVGGAHGVAEAEVHRGLVVEQPRGLDGVAVAQERPHRFRERLQGFFQCREVAQVDGHPGAR